MTTPFNQPDMTAQGGTQYKTNIDDGIRVLAQIAAGLNVQAQDTPDMTVKIIGCRIWRRDTAAAVTVATQNTATITAPAADPRIDLVSIDLDPASGNFGDIVVTTGSEAETPAVPAVPAGHVPLAQIALTVGQSSILNVDITDLRHMRIVEGALFLAVDDTEFQILTAVNVQQLIEEIDGLLLAGAPAGGFHVTAGDGLEIDVTAGVIYNAADNALTVKAAQNTTLSAPAAQDRIDRVVLNIDPAHEDFGLIDVIEGTEDASPVAPALSDLRYPLAQVAVAYEQTQLAQTDITDERPAVMLPPPSGAAATNEVYQEENDYIALAAIPVDNTIPQNTEGTEIFYVPFSLSDADNRLEISWSLQMGGGSSIGSQVVALFQGTDADAFHAKVQTTPADSAHRFAAHAGRVIIAPNTTDEIVYKLRAGGVTSLSYLNGTVGGAVMGNARGSSILLRELPPENTPDYSGLDAATQAYIAAMDIKPTLARAQAIDAVVTGLKSAGIWSKLDCLYLFAAHHRQASRLNVVAPATLEFANVGSPVFQSDKGWISPGTGNYLSLGDTVANLLTQFTQDDAHAGIYAVNNVAQNVTIFGTTALSTFYIAPRLVGNVTRFALNDGTNSNTAAVVTGNPGHLIANRPDSGSKDLWRDGTQLLDLSVASVSLPTGNIVVCAGQGTTNTVHHAAVMHMGAGLSSGEIASFTSIIDTYLTAVGAV